MKKFYIIMLIVCLAGIPLLAQTAQAPVAKQPVLAESKFYVALYGNFFNSGDSNYRAMYGSFFFVPELKVGYEIVTDLYIWAGLGYFKKTGSSAPHLQSEITSTQYHISGGLEYQLRLGDKMRVRLDAGICDFSFKEEGLDSSLSDSAIGFRADAGLVYLLNPTFFAELTAGYSTAAYTANKGTSDEMAVTLGGLKVGVGLGLRF